MPDIPSVATAFPPGVTLDAGGTLRVAARTLTDGVITVPARNGDALRVVMGEGSSCVVFDPAGSSMDLAAGPGSSLMYVSLLCGLERSVRLHVSVESEAKVRCVLLALGGDDLRMDLRSEITGEGGRSDVVCVSHARGEERQTFDIRNVFAVPHGAGEITMKAVAEDRAHVTARGMIEIAEGGGGTNTYLTQDVLMLDASAKVDAVPGLEIRTNDVKASHSATVTRVTPEDLFYFASRGIPAGEARSLFIHGFLADALAGVSDLALRDRLVQSLDERLQEKD